MKRFSLLTFVVLFVVPLSLLSAMAVAEDENSIRIGLLTDVDSLPFLVASSEGLFAEAGIAVDCIVFQNPVDRDAAFEAGEVDGIIADVLGTLFRANGEGKPVVVTSITSGRYGLAGTPGSSIASPADLAGVPIGVSSNTVIEYVAAAILTESGVAPSDIVPMAVPRIPVRMELLINGELGAACLPEPLYSLVVKRGAVPLGDSDSLSTDLGVMLFYADVVSENHDTLVALYDAYWQAAERINADPDAYRDFLVERMGFPTDVRDDFAFVPYERPRLPGVETIDAIAAWMVERGLIDTVPAYDTICDPSIIDALP